MVIAASFLKVNNLGLQANFLIKQFMPINITLPPNGNRIKQ